MNGLNIIFQYPIYNFILLLLAYRILIAIIKLKFIYIFLILCTYARMDIIPMFHLKSIQVEFKFFFNPEIKKFYF
jgi:hypothetical protein